jgi:hypothetical protein
MRLRCVGTPTRPPMPTKHATLTHEDVFGAPPSAADETVSRRHSATRLSDDVAATKSTPSSHGATEAVLTPTRQQSGDAAEGEPGRTSSLLGWMSSAFSPAAPSAAKVHAPPPSPAQGPLPSDTPQQSWLPWRRTQSSSPAALSPAPSQPNLLQRIASSLSRLTSGAALPATKPAQTDAAEDDDQQKVERSLDMDDEDKPQKRAVSPPSVRGEGPAFRVGGQCRQEDRGVAEGQELKEVRFAG